MRYIRSLCIALCASVCVDSAFAAEVSSDTGKVLERIEAANDNVTSISSDFIETKELASGKKIASFGQIYISLPSKMDMQYDQPEGNRFLINEDIMCQKRGRKENKYDLNRNTAMRDLSNTLLWSFSGKLTALAEAYHADVTVNDDGSGLLNVTLKSNLDSPRGYGHIRLYYDKSTYHLVSMILVDQAGVVSTRYEMTSPIINGKLPENAFIMN